MPNTFFVPMVKLNAVCDRARARYLARRQITDPGWRQEGRYGIPAADRARDPAGWIHISNLADRIASVHYRILWHPDTDNLHLDGPRK